jgi:hypothetical protein
MKKIKLLPLGLILMFVYVTSGLTGYASFDIGQLFTDALFSTEKIVFEVGSSKTIGSVGTNGDDVNFGGNTGIDGDLYIGPGFTPKSEWNSKVKGQILNISEEREFVLPEIIKFPELAHKESLKLKGNNSITISGDGQYNSIEITSNNTLTIGTGANPSSITRIVINSLDVKNGSIKINGEGKLHLYVGELSFGSTTVNFNATGSEDKCYVVLSSAKNSDTLKLMGNSTFKGNFIINVPNFIQDGSAKFIGNILFTGDNYLMSSSATSIKGLLYAPNAKVSMGGSSNIIGGVISKSYVSNGGNTLVQMNLPKSFVIPEDLAVLPIPQEEPTPDPEEPAPVPIPEGDRVLMGFPYAYMYGYEHGDVGADDYIKREEASALIYRLMKQNNKLNGFVRPNTATFTDVPPSSWAFSAMEFMTYIGVFDNARSDVAPLQEMTRGEVAKIITFSLKIRPDDSKDISFDDLPENSRYYEYIKALVDEGVMIGDGSNTIRPNALITRAEFVTMFNRIIGRDSDRYCISAQESLYPDLNEGHWAYNDIMRASFGFSDELNEEGKYEIDPSRKPSRYEIDYN